MILLCLGNLSAAQVPEDLEFNHITSEQGLSQSSVNTILQDSEGFMWFGTNDGLNRYNGYEMRVYKPNPEDTASLNGAHIISLLEDSRNRLWIGTSGMGLNWYDRDLDRFESIRVDHSDHGNSISDDTINDMLEDDQGRIWIGTSIGLNWYLPDERRFIHFYSDSYYPDSTNEHTLSDNTITSLAKGKDGSVWVGTEHGLNRWNPRKGNFTRFLHDPGDPYSLSDNFIWTVYMDSGGTLWVGTKNGGLNYFDPETERFHSYRYDPGEPGSIPGNSVDEIYEDSRGVLWVGTERKGLNHFDRDTERFYRYQHEPGDETSLANNAVHYIYESRDRILWIGTFTGGVNYVDLEPGKFEHYEHDPAEELTLSHNSVSTFLEDSDGNFWVGTDGGGLNLFDHERRTFRTIRHRPGDRGSLSSDVILDMVEDPDGTLWLAYYAGGISKYDPDTGTFTHYRHEPGNPNSLSNDDVFVLLRDRGGHLWAGTNGGDLNRYQPETNSFKRYTTWQDIRSLYEDDEGYLWVGSYGEGLIRLDPETEQVKKYRTTNSTIESNVILVIHKASDGHLWLGTNGGLIRFDRDRESFRQYNIDDGLPNMVINGILEDGSGHLWLSTNEGLSRFNLRTEEFKNYGVEDGLQGMEFKPLSYYKDREGYLYFGGINGFNRFHPDSVKPSTTVAPVKLTQFSIFNQPVYPGGNSPLDKQISVADRVELPYSASVLTFEYAALNFSNIKGNEFAYKMVGFDQEWNYVGDKRSATYTNLDPGEYRFKVMAANSDGVWSSETAELAVVITPPFWQTGWFYLVSGLAVAGLIFGGYRYRVRNIRRQNLRLEQTVARRTEELNRRNEELREALEDLNETREELINKAHKAGMADLATGVLHNVGNILNSVITSTAVIDDSVQNSKIKGWYMANELLMQHEDNLAEFLTEDPRGKNLLKYYSKLEKAIREERKKLLAHNQRLKKKVRLINEVIAAQQSIARAEVNDEVKGNLEKIVEDVLTLQAGSIERHQIEISTEIEEVDPVSCQKTKLMHVLINLFKNAKDALQDVAPGRREIRVRLYQDDENVYLTFSDNGSGIREDQVDKIFSHGFTTKKEGHGFGLHSSANYMTEMGGRIRVESEGPGKGATFILTFPRENDDRGIEKSEVSSSGADHS